MRFKVNLWRLGNPSSVRTDPNIEGKLFSTMHKNVSGNFS